jgi:hypothetical protein
MKINRPRLESDGFDSLAKLTVNRWSPRKPLAPPEGASPGLSR